MQYWYENMYIYKYIFNHVFQIRFRIFICPNIYWSEYFEFQIFSRPNFVIPNFYPSEYYDSEFTTIRVFLLRIFCYPNFFLSEFSLSEFLTVRMLNILHFSTTFAQFMNCGTSCFERNTYILLINNEQ